MMGTVPRLLEATGSLRSVPDTLGGPFFAIQRLLLPFTVQRSSLERLGLRTW